MRRLRGSLEVRAVQSPEPGSMDDAVSEAAGRAYLCIVHGLSYSSRDGALMHLKLAHGLESYDGSVMKEARF